MNIYVAGPMRGIKDFNFPEFFRASTQLRDLGHNVFNPAERDTVEYGSEKVKTATGDDKEVAAKLGKTPLELARECFLADTQFICAEADAIYLLSGWEKSKGAVAERALAEALGLKVIIDGEYVKCVCA